MPKANHDWFCSPTKIIDNTKNQKNCEPINHELSWKNFGNGFWSWYTGREEKTILFRDRFFDETNINANRESDTTLTKLKMDVYFEVIDAFRLQLNERLERNVNILLRKLLKKSSRNL